MVKPDYRKSRKRRIFLLYGTGVLIPGIILGYLAFRGVMNDQAIREKESRRRMETVRLSFFQSLDSLLFTDFHRIFPAKGGLTAAASDSSELAAFTVTPGGTARLLRHRLLWLPAEFLPPDQPGRTGFAADWEEAQKLEFAGDRPEEALKLYRSIGEQSRDTLLRLRSLFSQARILRRLGEQEEACVAYRRIISGFPLGLLPGRIPARQTALLELAVLEGEAGNMVERQKLCTDILNSLLNPEIMPGPAHFSSVYRGIRNLLDGSSTTDKALVDRLERDSVRTGRVLPVLVNPGIVLSNSNMHIIPLGTGLFVRSLYFNDLVALSAESRESGGPVQQMLVVDLGRRIGELAGEVTDRWQADGSFRWCILNENRDTLFREGAGTSVFMEYAFPEGFPKWNLCLAGEDRGLLAGIAATGHGLYLLIFVFIVIVMVFGLTFTLRALNQEIRLNALKSDFISNVSHELKSPLTSIRQRAELLTEKRVPSVQKQDYYEGILAQSEQLSHLIDNILDFSRIEDDRRRYRFEETDLSEFIIAIASTFQQRQVVTGAQVTVIPDRSLPMVQIDREGMQQVMFNLLDNACKFSAGTPVIEVATGPGTGNGHSQGEICIRVKDNGIGIRKKDRERIFERFYRAEEGRRRGIKGSGIGLTLVSRIVEAHKGRIRVESEPGMGTVFEIYLPVRQKHEI